MKKAKGIICITLSLLLLISITFSSFASFTPEEWAPYWNDAERSQTGLIMQPGTDESERNFSWYMPADTTDCSVLVSTSPSMTDAVEYEGHAVKTHQGDYSAKVTVTELEEDTTYYYTCVSGGKKSDIYSFSTIKGSDFSALFVSDVHISLDNSSEEAYSFEKLVSKAKSKFDVNMIISAGDQTMKGTRTELQGITASPSSRTLTFSPCIGNHDEHIDYKDFKNVPNEYFGKINGFQGGDYWFRKGPALFLVMNSNNFSAPDHRAFIKDAVEKNPDCKWRIVVMHHDLYGGSIPSRETENRLLRLLFTPIFDEFDIDLALLGHSHRFSVSDVIYDRKTTQKISNGETVKDADGTVYVVAASLTRPRYTEHLEYDERISMGMEDPMEFLYTILNFSENKIEVNTYRCETDELFSSFALQKTDEYEPESSCFIHRLMCRIFAYIGSIATFFDNFGEYYELIEEGLEPKDLFLEILNQQKAYWTQHSPC